MVANVLRCVQISLALGLLACGCQDGSSARSQAGASGAGAGGAGAGGALLLGSGNDCVSQNAGGDSGGVAPVSHSIPPFSLFVCLHTRADGHQDAVFSWTHSALDNETIAIGRDNMLAPGPEAQGQPEAFPAQSAGRFAAPLAEATLTWSMAGQSITASADSDTCTSECLGPPAGPDFGQKDVCTDSCGDGLCHEETCRACPSDCDCSQLEPILDCVGVTPDGRRYASFGYRNSALQGAGVALGGENHFLPGDEIRAQPWSFASGEHHDVLAVMYEGTELSWTLGNATASVGPDAPACASRCSGCAPGVACVGNSCVASCGDGYCAGEDCDTCPADCRCPGNNVCYHGGCASQPTCGIEGECGTVLFAGLHVECGDCPDGSACVLNVCRPLCAAKAP
jgi:hypothetical protein